MYRATQDRFQAHRPDSRPHPLHVATLQGLGAHAVLRVGEALQPLAVQQAPHDAERRLELVGRRLRRAVGVALHRRV